MPIAFAFMDDEGFLWEYLGNNTYSSEGVLSIGDPGSPTINVAINSTSIVIGTPTSNVFINSSSIVVGGLTCNAQTFSVLPINCTNDSQASALGVPVGGIYRNGSILMVRQT
jgi:hypothetical protein